MYAGIKTLDDLDLRHKHVLLRLDLNSDIQKGQVVVSERLTAPLVTIQELVKKKARVVILAHQGRPGSDDFTSLRKHAKALSKYIKIKFVPDTVGKKAIWSIAKMKDGDVLLLENVRMLKEEFTPSPKNKLVTQLVPLFDYYINDAFSASHRNQTSIVSFPQYLESAMGRVMEQEMKSISKLQVKNALFVLGGSKPSDNVLLVERSSNPVLASGLFAAFSLIAKGYNVGKENEILKDELSVLTPNTKKALQRVTLPLDLAVEVNGKRKDIPIKELPTNKPIYDLGKETIKLYAQRIKEAPAVYFKGLAGLCNTPAFSEGTKVLLKALASSKGFTVVSGGHTLAALARFKIPTKKIGYVSLSGGALVHYLAGLSLPGLEALKRGK